MSSKILVSGLFFSLVSVYGEKTGDLPYLILFVTAIIILLILTIRILAGESIHFRLSFQRTNLDKIDVFSSSTLPYLWFFIVFSWGIGAFIGILNGVETTHVFRNFFGLLVYLLFPIVLIVSPSSKSLYLVVLFAGIVQMVYGFEASIQRISNPVNFLFESSISELRSFYSTGFIAIFPLFTVGIAYQLIPKRYFIESNCRLIDFFSKSFIFTLLTFIALVVPAMSKGYILATALLLLGVAFSSFVFFLKSGILSKKLCILLIISIILLAMLPTSFYRALFFAFSSQEVSNAIRVEQFDYLVDDLTFIGNGLGSSLSSGYVRDDTGYGFELTYLNLIHKLGVFSIFLFLSYILTIIIALIRILNGVFLFESFFAIGLMGYLVVGLGNPLLLSPGAVVLHCVAMYTLLNPTVSKTSYNLK